MNIKSESNFDNNFSKTLNWFSLIIILICFGGLVGIISYLTLYEVKPIKNEVNIVTGISNNDTLAKNKIEINNYLKKVENRISDLQNVESKLDKKINEINDFYKFLGTILAIVIAITGFFGVKSLHELKIRNLENAKEVAKNEAILKVESELQNLKEKTISKIDEAKSEAKLTLLSEYYKKETQIEALIGDIAEINSRLNVIDNLERDFEDFNLRLSTLENKSIKDLTEVIEKKSKSSVKKKIVPKTTPNPKEDKLNEEEEFGEEGFESENKL